ncbi:MFS transporter [Kocuria rosea]|uniref:MFS transporter n=1 Tax=Kocuria rosea TaxID=1275 RepID=UPI000E056036|nr:MFS transporter [Kocuria rosea]STX07196.1 Arabinose efflux permease [Kocuria rosea]VEH41349.1 Arabinose efflux permease [Kocuria rosea]
MASTAPRARSGAWLWFLVAGALLTQTALNLVRPVTTYKLLSLDADSVTVGLVTAAYAVVPLVTAMWLGRMTDRVRDLRTMVVVGALVLALGAGALALAPSVALVAVASALLGMGHLVFTIAGQSAVARFSPPDQLDKGFGWFTAAFSAGQLVGPLLVGVLLGTGSDVASPERVADITLSLWIGAGLSVLVVPVMLLRRPASGAAGAPARNDDAAAAEQAAPATGELEVVPGTAPRASMLRILEVPGIPSHMLASLALLAMLDILTAFLPLVGERAGVSPAWIGVLLAVRGGASIVSRVLLPWLAHRMSRRALLLVSLYGAGITLAVPPAVITVPWLAAVLLFVGGFCLGLGQPITMTLVSTAVPTSWRGSALAVRLVGNRAGQVAMPLLAGLVAAPLGPAGAIWSTCAVLLVSGLEKTVRR